MKITTNNSLTKLVQLINETFHIWAESLQQATADMVNTKPSINDTTPSNTTVYSSNKVNEIFTNLNDKSNSREGLYLSDSWNLEGTVYTQTVQVNGILESDDVIVGLKIDTSITDVETIKNKKIAFGYIYDGITTNDNVKLYAYNKPEVDLNILFIGCQKDLDSVADLNGLKFQAKSQNEYDAIETKDPSTIYFIYEE